MAEESPFQNKRLLVVALALGLVFIVLFNYQGCMERQAMERNTVQMVLVNQDLLPDSVLTIDNVKPVRVPKQIADGMVGFCTYQELRPRLGIDKLQRPVAKNSYLQWADTGQSKGGVLIDDVTKGYQKIVIDLSRKPMPASSIGKNSRIDLWGNMSLRGQPPKMIRIVESLRVMTVNGQAITKEGQAVRAVEVEVPREMVESLLEILSNRLIGSPMVTVRGVADAAPVGKIAEDVQESLAKPAPAGIPGAGPAASSEFDF